MKKTLYPYRHDLLLLSITLIWGLTFGMVQETVSRIPIFWFLFLRFLLAALLFLPFVGRRALRLTRRTVALGASLGAVLFIGYVLQTLGLEYTTSARAGLFTGTFIIMTPLIAALLFRWLPSGRNLAGTGVAFLGLVLLSLGGPLGGFNIGDALTLGCAFFVALHLVLVGRYIGREDVSVINFLQCATIAGLSLIVSLPLEKHALPVIPFDWFTLIVTSLLATVIAFNVQIHVQKFLHPNRTALILTGEPVFAALFGAFLWGDGFTPLQAAGAALVIAGIIVSETGGDREEPDAEKFGEARASVI